jgi:hypothetical protein
MEHGLRVLTADLHYTMLPVVLTELLDLRS